TFTVVETGFGLGGNFLATWAAWRADPNRCERLAYVSIEKHPFSARDLRALINEDTERAREMVTRLSNTLRHALEQNDREHVRLAEELAVVDDYLAIEAVHYEQRLRVNRQIAPAALDARLPPMALQLLVENAIRHGIAVTPGGGELDLRADCMDGVLRLEVANPGRLGTGNGGHGVGLAYLRTHLGRDGLFELTEHEGCVLARLEIAQ
ncbi:histidine kinase, partial [Frateuria sp.]|uniref:sensor histidine kinase n=1 Tax=Frateuria sp. TaxID=2211372 RepID=UPI003F8065C2